MAKTRYDTAEEESMTRLTPEEKKILLQLACEAIRCGARFGVLPDIDLEQLTPALRQYGASFVTLEKDGQLQGCMGSIEPRQPLAEDVLHNAFAAAFYDPRFSPVREDELDRIETKISLISSLEPIEFSSEEELLQKIRPGIDGLLLEAGPRRGTFLPDVWEKLSDPREFLHHLKVKAGLFPDYWSDDIKIWRYTTEIIKE